jgi:PTH1 family peptidyl-tRNA hydrolase
MSRDDVAEAFGPSLIVGLGNPGSKYQGTRHNLGFRVVDELAARRQRTLDREACASMVAEDEGVLLVKPLTYMNRSGYAVRCLLEQRDLLPENMLVIYDEVHLPLGSLRLRGGGDPAGHRGMESIVRNVQTTRFPRLRMGVGGPDGAPAPETLADYVLEKFAADEIDPAEEMVGRAADAVEVWLSQGLDEAMNQFNRTSPSSQ